MKWTGKYIVNTKMIILYYKIKSKIIIELYDMSSCQAEEGKLLNIETAFN